MDQRPNWRKSMVDFRVYVEGGGSGKSLDDICRKGFTQFLEKAGVTQNRPRIVACGSRADAYDRFKTGLKNGQYALLLVDSEAPVTEQSPWRHLLNRPGDGWTKAHGATDDHCHFMVECMENWFLADRDTLRIFFGQDFQESALPAPSRAIETLAKGPAQAALKNATKDCDRNKRYVKGERSFDLLARIDPAKVTAASQWANRFVTTVKKGTP